MRRLTPSVLFLLLTAPAAWAGGLDRFVSPAGDDTANNCLSALTPCRTLAYTVSQSVSTDTIRAAGGTYKESVVLTDFGTLTIEGSYDPAFTVQDAETPTVLRSKGLRPLTALYNATSGALTLRNVTIRKSTNFSEIGIYGGVGGAMLVAATGSASAGVVLDGVTMDGNKGPFGGALALLASDNADVSGLITTSRFAKNKAVQCGAVLVESDDAPPPSLTIAETVFDGNKSFLAGGALCLGSTDPLNTDVIQTVESTTFTKNKTPGPGGAILAYTYQGHVNLTLSNSVFLGNKGAGGGGALATIAQADPLVPEAFVDVTSFNNTMTGNQARYPGSAIALVSGSGDAGTASHSSMDSTNDIVFGNKGGEDAYAASVGVAADTEATLSRQYGIYGSTLTEFDGLLVDGAGLLSVDPLFVKARKDIHLTDGSPAIDAGTCTGAPSDDFEGDSRPIGATCDIGADEH